MFEILTPTDAKLTSFNLRTEKHGDDDVLAFSMALKITTANTFLDALAPGLRDSLYKAVEGKEQLPGVDPSTPLLRCKGIDKVDLTASFEGWTLGVQHGIDEEPIIIGGAKVDKWRAHPCEGGSVDVTCRIGSNDVDETELGQLGGKLGQVISFTLTAPKIQEPAIDGSASGGGPGFDDEPERDATDLFAQIHGDQDGGPPDSDQDSGTDGEGSDTDIDGGPDLEDRLDVALAPRTELKKTVKYRNSMTGDTWSGRGLQPAWLKAALAAGRRLDEFAV